MAEQVLSQLDTRIELEEKIKKELEKKGVSAYVEICPYEDIVTIEVEDPEVYQKEFLKKLAKRLEDLGLEIFPEYIEYVTMVYTYDLLTGEKVNEESADWEAPHRVIKIEVSVDNDIEDVVNKIVEAIRSA